MDDLKILKFKPLAKHELLFLLVRNWNLILCMLSLSSYNFTCIHIDIQGLSSNLIIQCLFFLLH